MPIFMSLLKSAVKIKGSSFDPTIVFLTHHDLIAKSCYNKVKYGQNKTQLKVNIVNIFVHNFYSLKSIKLYLYVYDNVDVNEESCQIPK